MELSRGQRRVLNELGNEVAGDNPYLARALTAHRGPARWALRMHGRVPWGWLWSNWAPYAALILMVAGAPLVASGVLLNDPLTSVLGGAAVLGGPVGLAIWPSCRRLRARAAVIWTARRRQEAGSERERPRPSWRPT